MELDVVKELPRKDILTEWWSEVKENFWEQDARPQMQRLLKELMQRTLIEEIEHLRRRDVATDAPIISRNGYYRRSLITHVGMIPAIRVPRLRTGGFPTKVFRRYRRCERLWKTSSGRSSWPGSRRAGWVRPSVPCWRHSSPPAPSRGSPAAWMLTSGASMSAACWMSTRSEEHTSELQSQSKLLF